MGAEAVPREATSDAYSVKLYRVKLYRELPGAGQETEAETEEKSVEPDLSRLRRQTRRWW